MVQGREERCDSMFYRLIKAFMRGSFEPRVDYRRLEVLDAEHLAILFEKVVTKIAESGNCVIVGRGATWFLRDRDDAFHAFLYAPYDEKMRRLLAQGESRERRGTPSRIGGSGAAPHSSASTTARYGPIAPSTT